MKLRRQPEDFEVIERSSLPVGRSGEFAVYELRKTGWTTLDAIDKMAREIEIPRKNIEHAGLKDRHAVTTQRITIRNGPRQSFEDGEIFLNYLGQSTRPISADDISENTFRIVLRSLSERERDAAEIAIPEIQQSGVPNYFDEQRFGSWFPEHGFIAEAWIRGRYEDAFRLAFAEPERTDNPEEREQKAILRENWGDWILCKQLLSRSHRRSIVTYLCDHPTDFKKAWATVNGDLRGLYLSALQSDLWNRIVSASFAKEISPEQMVTLNLKTGPLNCPKVFTKEQSERYQRMQVPLPSGRLQLSEFPDPELVETTLQEQGWKLHELKVKFPRDRFFSRAYRPVMIPVQNFRGEFAADELSTGLSRLTLRFSLSRGSYATMVIKRLFLNAEEIDLEETDAE
ncbi:tRNA pseudouridine(13) synthase TruD [Planctomicrobium sp. SH527]|uniref:tRNA pseudouridine(13) synthase TruD n=1 Tax=Planctomicrobium sp. SH527 TaxID=3448123 RepID=UPI003F5C962D